MNVFRRTARKARRFAAYPADLKVMYAEAYFYLAWARVLKLLPFAKVAPSLGTHSKETSYASTTEQDLLQRKVAKAVHAMSRVTWWESQCMVKAVAAMKMLRRRGVASTLYLGSGRDEGGKMIAHAWLRSGSYYVTGNEKLERFAVVAVFGNDTEAAALSPVER